MEFQQDLLDWMQDYPLTNTERPNWDEYYLMIAFFSSRRSSCLRHKIGAIIVKDNQIVSSGYNGSPPGSINCCDRGYCMRDKEKIESNTNLEICYASGSHAESNAIVRAGRDLKGATLYLYGHQDVCNFCRGLILQAGISKVVHLTEKDHDVVVHDPQNWIEHEQT